MANLHQSAFQSLGGDMARKSKVTEIST